MFPLSEEFVHDLQLALFFVFCVFCFLTTTKSKLFILPPLGTYVIFSIWTLANAGDGYAGLDAAFLVLSLLVILIAGGLWALALYFIFGQLTSNTKFTIWKGTIHIVAALPIFVVLVAALSQQYVPPSKCSTNSIEISIGDNTYKLRREYNSMVRTVPTSSKKSDQYHYSFEPEDKKYLRVICELSNEGEKPISINQLWIKPKYIRTKLEKSCKQKTIYSDNMCSEYPNIKWENIRSIMLMERSKFTENLYGLPFFFFQNILELKNDPSVLAGGDQKTGYVCRKEMQTNASGNHCFSWRHADPKTILIGVTERTVDVSNIELLEQINSAMELLMLELQR